MDKRGMGLIGKIFLWIGIIVLILLIIAGVTAYQVYKVYEVAKEEQAGISEDVQVLSEQKDCSRVDSIQARALHIKSEAESACRNPIISIGVKKFMANKPMNINGQNVVVDCKNLNSIYTEMTKNFQSVKETCNKVKTNLTSSS